jgi:outer membrane protein OmpA-like peptidoglycan-associated protein
MRSKIFSILFIFSSLSSFSQEFLGFANSNFSGTTGSWLQPSSLADSRFKADIHLVGGSFNLNNNFFHYDAEILSIKKNLFDDTYFYDNRIKENKLYGDPFSLNINTDIQALSFMYSINDANTIGFSLRHRLALQIDGVDQDLLDLAMEDFNDPRLFERTLNNERLSIQHHNWLEYNFQYGRVLKDDNQHFMKAGANFKILNGLSAAYVYSEELRYIFNNKDTLSVTDSDLSYGYSDKTEEYMNNFKSSNLLKKENSSVGLDLGFVYEYRPNYKDYKYDMDGQFNMWEKDVNKYLFKVGASLLDLGKIKYNKGNGSRDWYLNFTHMDLLSLSNVNSVDELTDSLTNRFSNVTEGESFSMQLPTAFSLQFDYCLSENIYLNFTPFWGFQRSSNPNKTHAVTNYSLTPRWESKWLDVALPIHYDQYKNMGIGMSLRLGPLLFGVNNFKNIFKSGHTGDLELYTALKISVPYKTPKDDDKDGISNFYDLCPQIAGDLKHKGCPDKDGDNVPDRLDYCPDVAGLEQYNGCPDTDTDSIIDRNDDCPEEAGPLWTNGCPDNDNDSIPNAADECPNLAGPKNLDGCPDTDKDGLIDPKDECPLTPGPVDNNGCPVLEEIEKAVVNTAFANLEFQSKKDIIKKSSLKSLDDLALLMLQNTAWYLKLSGHTDNQGTSEFNLELSKRRALAVQNYLMEKGLIEERFILEFFGETAPIADNDTETGRQQNRRVEMKIIFE